MRRRLRGWRLVAKWTWRHRKLLDKGERMVARTDPAVWWFDSSGNRRHAIQARG